MLIAFEGIDGSGKTTTAQLLIETLNCVHKKAIIVDKKSPQFEQQYIANRMNLLKKVIWEYGNDPVYELGNEHSIYLLASWFMD
jgi:thymidylate kinase